MLIKIVKGIFLTFIRFLSASVSLLYSIISSSGDLLFRLLSSSTASVGFNLQFFFSSEMFQVLLISSEFFSSVLKLIFIHQLYSSGLSLFIPIANNYFSKNSTSRSRILMGKYWLTIYFFYFPFEQFFQILANFLYLNLNGKIRPN